MFVPNRHRTKSRRPVVWAARALGIAVASCAGHASAGVVGTFTITGDANSQISSAKTYTAKADPGGDAAGAAVINGVTFDVGTPTGTASATTYSAPGVTYSTPFASLQSHAGVAFDLPTGGIGQLLTDMVYTNSNLGNGNTTTLTFTGLTPGQTYSARIYYRAWDNSGARPSLISFDEDGAGPLGASAGVIDEDAGNNSDNIANALTYDYTAVNTSLVVSITAQSDNNSWHMYGMTNEVTAPEPASLGLLGLGGLALRRRRRRA